MARLFWIQKKVHPELCMLLPWKSPPVLNPLVWLLDPYKSVLKLFASAARSSSVPWSDLIRVAVPFLDDTSSIKYPAITFGSLLVQYACSQNHHSWKPFYCTIDADNVAGLNAFQMHHLVSVKHVILARLILEEKPQCQGDRNGLSVWTTTEAWRACAKSTN